MSMAMLVTRLGRGARSTASIKLRQPLARATVVVPAEARSGLERLSALVAGELNVKELTFAEREADLVEYHLLPDNKVLGPRFGRRFPQLRAELAKLDPAATVRQLRLGQAIQLTLEDEAIEILPEEVLVNSDPKPGLAVSAEVDVTVAVDTRLTDDLIYEGLARELVRRVQTKRKEADFQLEDRIVVHLSGGATLNQTLDRFGQYVAAETLSVEIGRTIPDRLADEAIEFELGEEPVRVAVERHV
jgi:isoleucyl-tRNA synthetase